jgi:hypothetical protein
VTYRPTSDTQTRAVSDVIRAYREQGLEPALAVFDGWHRLCCQPPTEPEEGHE